MDDEEAKALLIRIDERTAQLVSMRLDHENRIRSIEKSVWLFTGIAAGASVLVNFIIRKLGL